MILNMKKTEVLFSKINLPIPFHPKPDTDPQIHPLPPNARDFFLYPRMSSDEQTVQQSKSSPPSAIVKTVPKEQKRFFSEGRWVTKQAMSEKKEAR